MSSNENSGPSNPLEWIDRESLYESYWVIYEVSVLIRSQAYKVEIAYDLINRCYLYSPLSYVIMDNCNEWCYLTVYGEIQRIVGDEVQPFK